MSGRSSSIKKKLTNATNTAFQKAAHKLVDRRCEGHTRAHFWASELISLHDTYLIGLGIFNFAPDRETYKHAYHAVTRQHPDDHQASGVPQTSPYWTAWDQLTKVWAANNFDQTSLPYQSPGLSDQLNSIAEHLVSLIVWNKSRGKVFALKPHDSEYWGNLIFDPPLSHAHRDAAYAIYVEMVEWIGVDNLPVCKARWNEPDRWKNYANVHNRMAAYTETQADAIATNRNADLVDIGRPTKSWYREKIPEEADARGVDITHPIPEFKVNGVLSAKLQYHLKEAIKNQNPDLVEAIPTRDFRVVDQGGRDLVVSFDVLSELIS
ncbi:hypothetical protein HDU76_003979 [Blyttiomyces sp. JEL0837]|nr:hypothetical protein HDU76_003979 [Blyttiomyces sp. JEL0837]